MSSETPSAGPPRVFMSYSWTSDLHADWIRGMADRLIADGVDVILDQYDLKQGQDKFAFMERMVNDPTVTHVLAWSDERYAERADGRAGGVGAETLILTPKVYAEAGQERVIPIILGVRADGSQTLPTFLAGRWAINMSTPAREPDAYEELLRVLYGKPRHTKPAPGTPPSYITAPAGPMRALSARVRAFVEAAQRERETMYALAYDVVDAVTTDLETFRIMAVPDGAIPDEVIVEAIGRLQPLRDDSITYLTAVVRHREDSRLARITGDLLERLLAPQTSVVGRYYSWQWDHFLFLKYDLFLHATALAVKHHRLDLLTILTDRAYILPRSYHGRSQWDTASFAAFNEHIESLERFRNERLFERRRTSVTADLIKERTTFPGVPFEDLIGADQLLWLKSVLITDGETRWYPRLSAYAESAPSVLRRAVFRANFADLKTLLHVTSGDELRERFTKNAGTLGLNTWFPPYVFHFGNPLALLLVDTLDTRE